MLIFFYIIKHIITHKNKILYNFFMYYLLPTIKKVKKIRIRSVFEFLYLLFENIYDKFEVYFLWIFTRSMLNTRLWIYIVNFISYLSIIEEKWPKIWHSNRHPNPFLLKPRAVCTGRHLKKWKKYCEPPEGMCAFIRYCNISGYGSRGVYLIHESWTRALTFYTWPLCLNLDVQLFIWIMLLLHPYKK